MFSGSSLTLHAPTAVALAAGLTGLATEVRSGLHKRSHKPEPESLAAYIEEHGGLLLTAIPMDHTSLNSGRSYTLQDAWDTKITAATLTANTKSSSSRSHHRAKGVSVDPSPSSAAKNGITAHTFGPPYTQSPDVYEDLTTTADEQVALPVPAAKRQRRCRSVRQPVNAAENTSTSSTGSSAAAIQQLLPPAAIPLGRSRSIRARRTVTTTAGAPPPPGLTSQTERSGSSSGSAGAGSGGNGLFSSISGP